MKASLAKFQKGLSDLQLYIEGLRLEKKLAQFHLDKDSVGISTDAFSLIEHLKITRASKKQFDYNSIIVSLYGLVERYIEELIRNYVSFLGKIASSYKSLPEQIIKNHINVSFELLKRTEQNRYKGPHTKENIITNLNSCINDPDNFNLNSDAFTYHTANFRKTIIDECFVSVGLPNVCKLVFSHSYFMPFLKEKGLDKLIDKIKKSSKSKDTENQIKSFEDKSSFYLNDLADRRNDVAHGVESDLLDHNLLLDYINFFLVFGKTLYEVLIEQLLPIEAQHHGFKIGKPTDVYMSGQVVCLRIDGHSIKLGDYIIGRNGEEVKVGKILELQINDRAITEFHPRIETKEVGIRVSCKLKKTHMISIIPKERKIIKHD